MPLIKRATALGLSISLLACSAPIEPSPEQDSASAPVAGADSVSPATDGQGDGPPGDAPTVIESTDAVASDAAPPSAEDSVDAAPDEVAPGATCTTDDACDDGDLCTGDETCDADGRCVTGTPVACDDGDPCTLDTCLHAAGGCIAVPDGAQCDDNDPCTVDICTEDACLNPPVNCDDNDPCTDDTCDTATGACTHGPALSAPPACTAETAYQQLQLTVRTATSSVNAGTDDGFELCLSDDLCKTLDVSGYDDNELGATNEFLWVVDGLSPEELERVTLQPTGLAADAWRPECVSIVADGELIYCNDQMNVDWLGSDASDAPSWSDPDADTMLCTSCYPTPLSHGPLIGHTTPHSARVWLRTAYATPITLRYSPLESMVGAITRGPITPTMSQDFVTVLQLNQLTPNTRYYYEVQVNGEVAKGGLSFVTAPASTATFDVAFGSCSKVSASPSLPLFEDIIEAEPDVMLMIGDNHYANSANPETLRAFYLEHHGVESVAELVAGTPTWATWDDHDFTGNNTNGTASGKEHALAAFHRFWANPPQGSGGYPGVWSSFHWADVEFFLVDDRYYRDISNGSMLGEPQLQWLLWGLTTSTATFKVLVSGSQWTQGGTSDSWAAYPAEWQVIVDHIMSHNIDGVVTVSGDVHRGEVRRMTEASETTYPLWEFTSSPLGNNTSSCPDPETEPDALLFCAAVLNYGLLRFDTTAEDPTVTFELRTVDNLVLSSHTVALSELTL
ncbi:MAG: alkaline phosphatase D family protein [Myxococcota bacterium]